MGQQFQVNSYYCLSTITIYMYLTHEQNCFVPPNALLFSWHSVARLFIFAETWCPKFINVERITLLKESTLDKLEKRTAWMFLLSLTLILWSCGCTFLHGSTEWIVNMYIKHAFGSWSDSCARLNSLLISAYTIWSKMLLTLLYCSVLRLFIRVHLEQGGDSNKITTTTSLFSSSTDSQSPWPTFSPLFRTLRWRLKTSAITKAYKSLGRQ